MSSHRPFIVCSVMNPCRKYIETYTFLFIFAAPLSCVQKYFLITSLLKCFHCIFFSESLDEGKLYNIVVDRSTLVAKPEQAKPSKPGKSCVVILLSNTTTEVYLWTQIYQHELLIVYITRKQDQSEVVDGVLG